MIQTDLNEALLPAIGNIDLNFVHNDRIISDEYRLTSDLRLAMAVQRQMQAVLGEQHVRENNLVLGLADDGRAVLAPLVG